MKKPRLMAERPLRSLSRGFVTKIPMTAVITPTMGMAEREDQALGAERLLAQDQGCHERHGVGLEEVSGHTGAVTDVVTDVVSDGRGVARVVLGNAGFDLSDQVGADVSGLGEDSAADPHEHGEQCCAEAEALQHLRRVALVGQHDDGSAEQAEADCQHADGTTGAGRRCAWRAAGPSFWAAAATRTFPRTARPMPEKPTVNEASAPITKNTERPTREAVLSAGRASRISGMITTKTGEGLWLTTQERFRAFLDGECNLSHARGPGVSSEDLAHEYVCDSERQNGDHTDHCYEAFLASGQ